MSNNRSTERLKYEKVAARPAEEGEESAAAVARQLWLHPIWMYSWRAQLLEIGAEAFPGKAICAAAPRRFDDYGAKARFPEERDIPKKAPGFFSRESR